CDRSLRQRHRETAFGCVVDERAARGGLVEATDELRFRREVERRRPAGRLPCVERLVLGAVEREPGLTGEVDRVSLAPRAGKLANVADEADTADGWSGVD